MRVENGSFFFVNLVVKNSENAFGNSRNVFCDNVGKKRLSVMLAVVGQIKVIMLSFCIVLKTIKLVSELFLLKM